MNNKYVTQTREILTKKKRKHTKVSIWQIVRWFHLSFIYLFDGVVWVCICVYALLRYKCIENVEYVYLYVCKHKSLVNWNVELQNTVKCHSERSKASNFRSRRKMEETINCKSVDIWKLRANVIHLMLSMRTNIGLLVLYRINQKGHTLDRAYY